MPQLRVLPLSLSLSLSVLAAACLTTGLGIARPSSPATKTPIAAEPAKASAVESLAEPTPAAAEYGTIKGRLVWKDATIPQPKILVAKGNASVQNAPVCAAADIPSRSLIVDPKSRGVKNGLAYLVKPKGSNPELEKAILAKTPKVVIDQKNCQFVPYVAAIMKSQALAFTSQDPINHNVHGSGFNNAFNRAVGKGQELDVQPAAERLPLRVVCDIHGWMRCFIGIYDHPFFAVTDDDGSFEIRGVPAGKQNLVVWQELQGFVTPGFSRGKPIDVPAGGVVDIGEVALDSAKVKQALSKE